ncbi:hypothetical protein, partial [Flavobacterium sp. HTF]|uniref:hypothetical protein n=1 Tax=Flavobacterium sp. HTF TaxID=2170732 RepID=UPI000D5ECB8D
YIENNQKTTERQFKFYKKNEFDYSGGEEICYKIPLHTLPTKKINDTESNPIGKSLNYSLEFKTKVFELFADILNEDQIKELFLNSFSFGRSDGRPTYLNFEFKNSKKIYQTFFELYQFYNSERNSLLRGKQILEKKKQDKGANTTRVRRKFAPQLLNNKITKLDIMKIMYNSFPQVRDNYKSFGRKKPLTTLDEYLLTKSRNIRKY